VKFMRIFADKFFAGRYSHRAVVLETVAAVPDLVGGWIVAAPEGPAPHS
jgi:ubiquinol oxidase